MLPREERFVERFAMLSSRNCIRWGSFRARSGWKKYGSKTKTGITSPASMARTRGPRSASRRSLPLNKTSALFVLAMIGNGLLPGRQSEAEGNGGGAIVEGCPERLGDKDPVDQLAKDSEGKGIIDSVFHHSVSVHL